MQDEKVEAGELTRKHWEKLGTYPETVAVEKWMILAVASGFH